MNQRKDWETGRFRTKPDSGHVRVNFANMDKNFHNEFDNQFILTVNACYVWTTYIF